MEKTFTKTFRGYKAKMGDLTVRVVNSGKNKDGAPLLKVRVGRYLGYAGDHSPVAQYAWGDAKWVRAEKVSK